MSAYLETYLQPYLGHDVLVLDLEEGTKKKMTLRYVDTKEMRLEYFERSFHNRRQRIKRVIQHDDPRYDIKP